jgi:hypothetical protein
MSTTPTNGKEFSGRPRYQPYTGPRIYKHVSRGRPCLICGKTDWCSYSLNGEVSCCARKTEGADYISKKEGWGIYFHNKDAGCRAVSASAPPRRQKRLPPPTPVAPLEVRDAVYRKLMELSPATNHPAELIEGEHGLLTRGFTEEDFPRFGSLPAKASDRAALARELRMFVRTVFYEYAEKTGFAGVVGVPGFWQEKDGSVRLWVDRDEAGPMLLIPYRDLDGRIQACQFRRSAPLGDGQKRYSWLSTPAKRKGVTSGTPIHYTFRAGECPEGSTVIMTEGGLKARAFVRRRPKARVLATSGVTCSHELLIAAARGRRALAAFDADHRQNKNVCRHLARLIAAREQDAEVHGLGTETRVVVWETVEGRRDKGIDDAALLGLPLRSLAVAEWYATLSGAPLEEVTKVWREMRYEVKS